GLRNRLVGVEIDEQIANQTRQRLSNYPNVAIVAGDILENMPPDGTIYFTYNSATAPILARFRAALFEMSRVHDNLVFIYYTSRQLSVFLEDDRWNIQRIRMPSSVDAAIIRPRKFEPVT